VKIERVGKNILQAKENVKRRKFSVQSESCTGVWPGARTNRILHSEIRISHSMASGCSRGEIMISFFSIDGNEGVE
jgi:hypothetical protein